MNVATLAALRTPEGQKLLADAGASREDDPFAVGTRLRRDHSADLVAAALTQAELRHRARAKFDPADAERMYFTVDGLEQATRASVATHRARRVVTSLLGDHDQATGGQTRSVADLCCGIGGDLIALARAGLAVTGVEADPLTAAVAAANVVALGLDAHIECTDAQSVDRRGYTAVVCDPARRTGRGRVFNPDLYQPPWPFVEELLRGAACVKVAPGIPHDRVPAGVEAEWVSDTGDVKEAALWSGDFRSDGASRRATLLPSGTTVTDADAPADPPLGPVSRWLIEPDGAVIRAGLVTAVAAQTDGWLMDRHIAYVACPAEPRTQLGRIYEVTGQLPYDLKRLRAYVRVHSIGTLTIKKRGVDVDPAALRRQLRPSGENETTFIITRVANRALVLVATAFGATGR